MSSDLFVSVPRWFRTVVHLVTQWRESSPKHREDSGQLTMHVEHPQSRSTDKVVDLKERNPVCTVVHHVAAPIPGIPEQTMHNVKVFPQERFCKIHAFCTESSYSFKAGGALNTGTLVYLS